MTQNPDRTEIRAGANGTRAERDRFILRGRRGLLEYALFVGHATMDDVHDLVVVPPEVGRTCLRAVPGALATAGIIRAAGRVPTCRPTGRSRPVTVWEIVDAKAAKKWLREHPDRDRAEKGTGFQDPKTNENEAKP